MDILLASLEEISPELELARTEIIHSGYKITQAIKFDKVISLLKSNPINIVLINGDGHKFEAYDLCREIRDGFRGAIKIYVYLPESTVNEASRFGLLSAEVEDRDSISNIINKFSSKKHRDYVLDENVSSIVSLSGGCGVSTITILLAYILDHYKRSSLLVESGSRIKQMLKLKEPLALLARDRSKEINQNKDLDWFRGFTTNSEFIPRLSYLNLFSSIEERMKYLDQRINAIDDLAMRLETESEHKNKSFNIANSLKLLAKDLDGDSFSLFDEIIQFGSKLAPNLFFDLGSDISSPVNKQLLRFSKNLILVFRDHSSIKSEYQNLKKFIEEKYSLNIIPILAPGYYHYAKYQSLTEFEWAELLGEKPIIYPYSPESTIKLIRDREGLESNDKLFVFARELVTKLGIQLESSSLNKRLGVLKFLNV